MSPALANLQALQTRQHLIAQHRHFVHVIDEDQRHPVQSGFGQPKELLRDLQRAPEFDQSAMFKKVYEEEYGVFGGAPFSALVGNYEFGRGPEDIELLEKVAQVASADVKQNQVVELITTGRATGHESGTKGTDA